MELSAKFLEGRNDLHDVDIYNQWRLLMTEDEIQHSVRKCAGYINKKFQGRDLILICILKGAIIFYVDLIKHITIPYSTYFISAKSYYNNQSQSDKIIIEGNIEPSKFEGKTVVLIDELFDSGHTMNDLVEAIHQKANVSRYNIYTCVLFRKNKKIANNICHPDYSGIVVPDVWLVGYGLDDKQEKRGWTHLYAVPKSDPILKTADDDIVFNMDTYIELRKKFSV